jgi:hypothetical protein
VLFDALDKFKRSSDRGIAKYLIKYHPGFYPDAEEARRHIRYYRGTNGKKNRDKLSIKKYVREPI